MSDAPRTSSVHGEDILRCDGLVVGYRGKPLLPPLSLSIRRGRLVLVVGRNGAGKSTWLKTVLGLIPPVAGRLILGQPGRRPRVSYVPQQARIDDLLPVRASTVAGWGQLRGWSFLRPLAGADDRHRLRAALAEAEADAFASQPFRDLSGGQRQRTLFARLLAAPVDLALLDEPTASMDMTSERQAYERMAHMARERTMALVVVTHTLGAAAAYADDVLFVDRGANGSEGLALFDAPEHVFAHSLFRHYFGEVARDAR